MTDYCYFYLFLPKLQVHLGFQLTRRDVFLRVYHFLSLYVAPPFKICFQDRNLSKNMRVQDLLPYVLVATNGRLPATKGSAVKLWLRFPGQKVEPSPPPPCWTTKITNTIDVQNSILLRNQQQKKIEETLPVPPEIVSLIMSYVPDNIKYVYMPHILWYDWYDYISDSD